VQDLLADRDVHLTLCLTHDCNLRCRYCYGGDKAPRHMSGPVLERSLELAFERAGDRLHLVFFGGEPLLRWEQLLAATDEALAEGRRRGVEVRPTVTTNATLLTADRAAELAGRGFVVAVSCDGTAAAHDAHRVDRVGRGSHDRTMAGLRAALAEELPVRVVSVLQPDTVADLPASVALLRQEGVTDMVVSPDWSARWDDEVTRQGWEAAYEAVADLWAEGYRGGAPFWISIVDDKVATHVKGGYLPAERCDLGRTNLVVAPSGRLYPCDRLVVEDRGGGHEIGDVEHGVELDKVRSLVEAVCGVPTECGDCDLALRCRNRCACANIALTGDAATPSETLCFHEQIAIRAADRVAAALYEEGSESFRRRYYGQAAEK